MLNQPTLEKLQAMKLHGMAEPSGHKWKPADSSQLSFEERFGCWSTAVDSGKKIAH